MYPDFQHLLQGIFGTDMPSWLSIFKTFGLLVAFSFLGAAWTLTKELKRKQAQGLLVPTYTTIEVGQPATVNELLISALIGFLLGFKIGGIFGHIDTVSPDPMGYVFSPLGNLGIGIAGAILAAGLKYYEKKKQELPEVQTKKIAIYPHQRISEITMIAAVAGLAGAKIFNALETWDDFIKNPIDNLVSSSGLTFYGGLIVATIALIFYARKYQIPFKHLCDAAAPGLMLAYGLGRLGCQFAGDGDWGIFNSAYITEPNGVLRLAKDGEFQGMLQNAHQYFIQNFGSLAAVPHKAVAAPSWLPDWMFAMNYPHNVGHEGVQIMNCFDDYCTVLPVGVFPTPLYEAVVCTGLFFVLWSLRKRFTKPLQLFGVYLILNGVERFFVEKIRVNSKYDWGFLQPTQAEIISFCLVLAGIIILATRKKKAATA
ncbi:MAG: prolipoprotein diacylglyceryl transferase [Bacteroidetes bacterium]|nr:prolipoprotein diacylglyceryl transferase [Bacteroidota bacterium]